MGAQRLGDDGLDLLRIAVADVEVVARYRAKIVSVPGSDCWWWTGAISGRGHGRFWYCPRRVAIAHRFAYALSCGVDQLRGIEVLGHRCDNPLCQRVGPGHVVASSHGQNRREWAARKTLSGSPLGDPRGSRQRAKELRDLARQDPGLVAVDQARLRELYGEQSALW